jgi:Flp pilus assembly protein TadG
MRNCKPPYRRGFVTIWVVLTLAVVLMLIGLAVDTSHAFTVGRELQDAADAAALAGASQISNGTSAAQTAAVTAAAYNRASGNTVVVSSNSDIVFGSYSTTTGTFTAGATPYTAIQVTTRMSSGGSNSPMPLSFGKLVGLNTANITRVAVAFQDTTQGSGVVVLNNSGSTSTPYTQSSSSSIAVAASGGSSGGVWVNSDSNGNGGNCSVKNSSSCCGTHLHCCGGCTCDNTSSVPSKCITGCQKVSDPCSSLCEPNNRGSDCGQLYVGGSYNSGQNYTCNSCGGYYSQGILVQNNSSLTLTAGTYCVGPPGVCVDNGCTLNAPNCTFVLCATTTGHGNNQNTACGCLNLSGGCNCNITPPTSGAYSGCCCCCSDHSCSASNSCVCCGGNCGTDNSYYNNWSNNNNYYNNNWNNWQYNNNNNTNGNICVSGTIYCPHYNCHCCGCGCGGGSCQLGSQVICDSMTVDTGSQVSVAYDGRNPVGVTGSTYNLVK